MCVSVQKRCIFVIVFKMSCCGSHPAFHPVGTGMVVLEEQIVAQLVKQFLAFYGTQRLIPIFIRACQV
jgi:hypothetical protein